MGAKKFRAKKAPAKAKPTKKAKKRTSQPTTKNEIELVSTVGILNTWRIQEYLDAIGTSERAWSDTPEGTKLFEEIRDELYEIRAGRCFRRSWRQPSTTPRRVMPRWQRRSRPITRRTDHC